MNKAFIANFLVRTNAFAPFRFINRRKLPILMYHRFSEREEIGKTSVKTLTSHLEYLTRNYNVISLTEAVGYIRDKSPFPNRSAVITIDDGYRDCLDLALPVFRRFGVSAVMYVVTDFVDGKCWIWTDKARFLLKNTAREKVSFSIGDKMLEADLKGHDSRFIAAGKINSELKKLSDAEKDVVLNDLAAAVGVAIPELPPAEYSSVTWDEARKLASENVMIGSHTVTHPILTNVDGDKLDGELRDSLAVLRDRLQTADIHFCYPNGNVSLRERDAVEKAGYLSAVTTEIRLCENNADPFLLPRIDAEPQLHRLVQATSGFDAVKKRK